MDQLFKKCIVILLFTSVLFTCKKDDKITEDPIVYDETGMLGLAGSPSPCEGHDSRKNFGHIHSKVPVILLLPLLLMEPIMWLMMMALCTLVQMMGEYIF